MVKNSTHIFHHVHSKKQSSHQDTLGGFTSRSWTLPKCVPPATSLEAQAPLSADFHPNSGSLPSCTTTASQCYMYKFQQLTVTASSHLTDHTGWSSGFGRRAHGWNTNRKRAWVRLPPREVKTLKTNKGVFVTNYLYPTGAGIGLVGELFCLHFSLIFPIALSSFHRKGLQGEHGVLFTSWLKKEQPETDQKFTLADAAR